MLKLRSTKYEEWIVTCQDVLWRLPVRLPFNVLSPEVQYNVSACNRYNWLFIASSSGNQEASRNWSKLRLSRSLLELDLWSLSSLTVPSTGNCSWRIVDIVAPGMSSSCSRTPGKSFSSNFIMALWFENNGSTYRNRCTWSFKCFASTELSAWICTQRE